MESLGPHKEPLTGFTIFRPLKAKVLIYEVFFLEVKSKGEDL